MEFSYTIYFEADKSTLWKALTDGAKLLHRSISLEGQSDLIGNRALWSNISALMANWI